MELNQFFDEHKSDSELHALKKDGNRMAGFFERMKEEKPAFFEAQQRHDFTECFDLLCKNMNISIDEKRFVYFFDFSFKMSTSVANVTADYELFLLNGLESLQYRECEVSNEFCKQYNAVLDDMMLLADRISRQLQEKKPCDYKRKMQWFQNMKTEPAQSFEEAVQRVLFLNQMLWQSGSILVGLGNLDRYLFPFYEKTLAEDQMSDEDVKNVLRDFLTILHEHYWYKSSVMLGDTGQVLVIGSSDKDGHYYYNRLTELLIELVGELQLSDPKIVLRVNRNTPDKIMEAAVNCMMTGVGSPLLSNDDVIIPRLIEFGVEEEDAYEYATSACWEPLVGGKSSSMNNEASFSYMRALHNLLLEENLMKITSFEELLKRYEQYLKREAAMVKKTIYERKYWANCLYSIFMDGCKESRKDITQGGAKYHNTGFTTIALGNTVNALLNIKKYVFEENRYSLVDVKKITVFNFEGYEELGDVLKCNENRYGLDKEEVIDLTNELVRFVSSQTISFRTPVGGKLKFGVSSPLYIGEGSCAAASFDGRKNGDPFMVHISNEKASSYTEIIHFAASLDYGENRFNGNVVDFMVSPAFIKSNFKKFVLMLKQGILAGFFQLQMNVIDSGTLIKAKEHPGDYENLIVRVWGFSAYFVELSEEYQNVLIARALENEGRM